MCAHVKGNIRVRDKNITAGIKEEGLHSASAPDTFD